MAATPTFNPFYPQGAATLQQIQHQQALADALTKEGMEPIQYDQRGPISPFQGVNKLAQALIGAGENNQANSELKQYNSDYMRQLTGQPAPAALGNALSPESANGGGGAMPGPMGSAPSGDVYPNGVPKLSGNMQQDGMMFASMGPEKYMESVAKKYELTNEQKNFAAGGPLADKAAYIEPINEGPGNIVLDPRTHQMIASAPSPEGYQTKLDAQGNATAVPVPVGQPAGQLPTQGPITNPPMPDNGPFGASGGESGALPISPQGKGAIPLVNGAPAPAALPPSTQVASNEPATLPEAIAKKAGIKTQAEDSAKNLVDSTKTLNVMQANLPVVLQRFQVMREAAKNAGYGLGNDNEGEGILQQYHQTRDDQTGRANTVIKQASSQGILPELGPQLAQAGIRGNKFLETLASSASGLSLVDGPKAKQDAIDGLERQYIQNLKSTSRQVRAQGGQAPTEEEIDNMVKQMSGAPAATTGGPISKVLNGVTYTKINGEWHQQ